MLFRSLGRGYAVLTDSAGKAVDEVSKVSLGQKLRAKLKDGVLDVTVDEITKEA